MGNGGFIMKKMSITQEYFICAANEKGKISSIHTDKLACLIVSCLFEMKMEGCISIEQKKVTICGQLSPDKAYLKPIYDILDPVKAMKLEKILDRYTVDISDKELSTLLNALGKSLEKAGAAETVQESFWGNHIQYVPKKEVRDQILNQIETKILGEEELSQEDVTLAVLLEQSGCFALYFPEEKQRQLEKKISQVRESAAGQSARQIEEEMGEMDTLLTTVSSVLSEE